MVDEFVRAFIHHGCTSIPVKYDDDGADGRKVKVLLDSLQSLPDAPFNLLFPTEPRLLAVCLTIKSAQHPAHPLAESDGLARLSSRPFPLPFLRATGLPFH